MTDTSLHCSDCRRALGPDDLYCARCGTPTPGNVDPEATLVVEVGSGASSLLADDPAVTATESAAPPAGATFKVRLRHVLGAEYEIMSLIGQGGFARVYKARDRRLGRLVAIKVIRPDMIGTKQFVESFRAEGIALAKLRDPAIIPIYDIRERGGLIYYVMPFVAGITLEDRLAAGRLPPLVSRRILSELADALAVTHRANMVHLDIKPANVFLEGDHQKVLLMDFGTAMAITAQVGETSADVVAGTPAYMSPEQARGLPDIDHRSDIYSLGALGYRMLMGRPPFGGRTAMDVLTKHIEEPPVPIRDIHPTIPKDFADAIMRCLDKDPWTRFQTAEALGGALEGVTFFQTAGEIAPGPKTSGVPGTVVALVAIVGLFLGVLAGLALG